MDNMLEHPGIELQAIIKEKGLTQKAFASILGKKVSEVNELLKGKRNITIQRDYLLHQTIETPIKYRILKQIDYDYSLLDIEDEPSESPIQMEKNYGELPQNHDTILDDNKNSIQNIPLKQGESNIGDSTEKDRKSYISSKIESNGEQIDSSSQEGNSDGQIKSQKTSIQEQNKEIDEDHQKRAKIFKSF